MRLVYEQYANGEFQFFQSDNDGENRRLIDGIESGGRVRRMVAFVTANFDDNQDGRAGALAAFREMLEHLEQPRRKVPAGRRVKER